MLTQRLAAARARAARSRQCAKVLRQGMSANADNLELGLLRAEATRAYLTAASGIPLPMLPVSSIGDEQLPFPDPGLNVRDALQLSNGSTAAHRKLKQRINSFLSGPRGGGPNKPR